MMATEETTTPRAWVGCLACYNAGTLRGEWVDGVDAAEFVPCEGRGHEEWWVMDHEGFAGMLTGECSPMEATRLAEALESVDDNERGAFAAWVAYEDGDATDPERFREQYRGEWDSLADYAAQLWEDTAGSREEIEAAERWPFTCIDWERAGRELELGGDVSTHDAGGGMVWVFEPNA